jgi:hypothetical protein
VFVCAEERFFGGLKCVQADPGEQFRREVGFEQCAGVVGDVKGAANEMIMWVTRVEFIHNPNDQ